MVTAFEEFKREIINAVKKQLAKKKLEIIPGGGAYVLINANSRDQQATHMLLQALDQEGVGYDTADENESILNLVEQYDFQGLMVVYGQCDKEWAKQQMRACREILLKKKQRAPVCAVYLGPPDEKPTLGISLPKVAQVSHRDRSTIASFLLAVQASLSGA